MLVDLELRVPAPAAVSAPAEAVLDNGRKKIVLVGLGDGYFEPRQVATGLRFDGSVHITRGLHAGEKVALGANFLLDSDTTLRLGQ
jgi:Cu(I)/Ag(I) efflux system membrane fusion protein